MRMVDELGPVEMMLAVRVVGGEIRFDSMTTRIGQKD